MKDDDDNDKNHGRRRNRRRQHEHSFTAYLTFGPITTICIGIFLFIYVIILTVFAPLLEQDDPYSGNPKMELHRGDVLKPVLNQMKQLAYDENGSDGAGGVIRNVFKNLAKKEITLMKKQFYKYRQEQNITDSFLVQNVKNFLQERTLRKKQQQQQQYNQKQSDNTIQTYDKTKQRNGFIVLGMHRSGTSLLSGLLVKGLGYNVGGPLIGSAFDNEKGFFELIDAVLQNDEFLFLQDAAWYVNVINYNATMGVHHQRIGRAKFKHGTKALQFLNNPRSIPYLQKDPRMCITIRTWLELLNHEPAIVFTYRHPVDVAMSLHKREKDISIATGLRLWIVYNMRAIQNSVGLCIVYSSNDAIMANPLTEVQRISDELTTKCNVPKPKYKLLRQEIVNTFVDPNLQHNKNTKKAKQQSRKVVATVGKDCTIYEFQSGSDPDNDEYELEQNLYSVAMKIYCDFQSGIAYQTNYDWPSLEFE